MARDLNDEKEVTVELNEMNETKYRATKRNSTLIKSQARTTMFEKREYGRGETDRIIKTESRVDAYDAVRNAVAKLTVTVMPV